MQVSGEWEGPSERRRGSILFLRNRTNPGFTWEWVAEVGLHGRLKNINNKNHIHKTTHQILNNPNIPKMRDRLYKLTFNTEGLGFVFVFKENGDEEKQILRKFLRKAHWFYFLCNYEKTFMTTRLTSVCFAGIYSLKVFIFFWSRKVFYWMERILWLKIIYKRNRILIHFTLLTLLCTTSDPLCHFWPSPFWSPFILMYVRACLAH